MNNTSQLSGKNYKFSIGSIFFLLAAVSSFLFLAFDKITTLFFNLDVIISSFMPFAEKIKLLFRIVGSGVVSNAIFVLSLATIGVLLILKIRNLVLALPPLVICGLEIFIIISNIFTIINMIINREAYDSLELGSIYTQILVYVVAIITAVIIILANLLFVAHIITSVLNIPAAPSILKWTSAPAIAAGTLSGIILSIVSTVNAVIMYISRGMPIKQILALLIDPNILSGLISFVLLTLAYLFASLWIAKPCKK